MKMSLPCEIIENILMRCDGKTLFAAQKVGPEWDRIVQYISERTPLWKWCCKEEIPENELLDYLERYDNEDPERWFNIYANWLSWHDINRNIVCDTIVCPAETQRISCIAVLGRYIAVGTEIGRVKIFTENWKPLYVSRCQAVKVTDISFIYEKNGGEIDVVDLCFVMAYPKTLIFDRIDDNDNELMIQDVKAHSVYRNYVCYEQLGGRVTIAKLNNYHGSMQLVEVWFDRIYSPSNISCMNIWNGVCTLLINREVKIIHYNKPNIIPVSNLETKTTINLTIANQSADCVFQILRDDIIISLCRSTYLENDEFIEFFILGDQGKYSKKLFNTWEALGAFITCIFVYGNTLVLGVDIGSVYFYHISSWKHLDVRDYQKKIIVGKHPIISISVNEVKKERTFYIASSFSVHKVVGFTNDLL